MHEGIYCLEETVKKAVKGGKKEPKAGIKKLTIEDLRDVVGGASLNPGTEARINAGGNDPDGSARDAAEEAKKTLKERLAEGARRNERVQSDAKAREISDRRR